MPRIPVEVDDLTAQWLEAALRPTRPGIVVTAVTVLDAHSGTTGRCRIGVETSDPTIGETLFVKLPPFTSERRAFVAQQGMGVHEAKFYASIAAEVPVLTPPCLVADYDTDGGYIMVFEDLAASGARFPTQRDDALVEVVDGVIDNFARMHAAFEGSSRFDEPGDLAWLGKRSKGYGAAAGLVQYASEEIGDTQPPIFHEMVQWYLEHVDAVVAGLASGPRTLVHGDAHIGNMYVTATNTVGFLDWAVTGFAPGLRDVAYFVGNSIPTALRREHETRLIERYCAGLADGGIDLPFDSAWNQYRLQMLTGWIAAVVTAGFGSALQPIEFGLRATERANQSLIDLDVLGAWQDHVA